MKASGGWARDATDEEIVEAIGLLARTEEIFAEMAGGVTLVATRKLAAAGRIAPDEPVVVCITGSGLKTVEALEGRFPPAARVRASLDAVEAAVPALRVTRTG